MQRWPLLAVGAAWLAAIQPLLLPVEMCWGVAGGEKEAGVRQPCFWSWAPHLPLTGMVWCWAVVIHGVRTQPAPSLHIEGLCCCSTYLGALAFEGPLVRFAQIMKNVAVEKRSPAKCEPRNEHILVCVHVCVCVWVCVCTRQDGPVLCPALAVPAASWRVKKQLLCVPNQTQIKLDSTLAM